MLHQEFAPPENLREMIKCFWYNKRAAEEIQSDFDVTPDGYAEIIFYFGTVISIQSQTGLQPLPSPFLMGLLNQPAIFHAEGPLEVIAIRCYPWAVFDLLGLPSGKDQVRVFKHPIAMLQSPLNTCIENKNIDSAVKLLSDFFLTEHSQLSVDNTLSKAGLAMRKTNGTLPVSEVAEAAHATVRTLERKFRQSSGHSVKDVSGLIRFEQVRNQLWINPASSISALAHEFGYTDQSHLSKEFKRYSGLTPAAFARKIKKEKLIATENFVAFLQS